MFKTSLFKKKDKNDKLNQMKSLGRRRKIHRVRCLNKLKRESESKFAVDRRGSKTNMAKKEKTNAFWGPYISNRQWGTVREDTSTDGNRFSFFTLVGANVLKLC